MDGKASGVQTSSFLGLGFKSESEQLCPSSAKGSCEGRDKLRSFDLRRYTLLGVLFCYSYGYRQLFARKQ